MGPRTAASNHDAHTSAYHREAVGGWSLKYLTASAVVLAMLILAVTLIGFGWVGARDSLLTAAARTATDAKLLIEEKSARLIQPAQAALGVLATDPIADATTFDQRVLRLRTFADLLAANNLAAAVFVGYADGTFLLIRPLDTPEIRLTFNSPPKSNFLVQSIEAVAGGKFAGNFFFYDAEMRLLGKSRQDSYRFDPRTRPWFQDSIKTAAAVASEPYIFFTTQQVGITLSQASRNGNAVIGIDILLDDVATSLADLRVTPNTEIAVLNAKQQVVAYRDMKRVVSKINDEFAFKQLDEAGLPSLSRLRALGAEQGAVATFDVDGRQWMGTTSSFDVWKTAGLTLLAAAPRDDFLGELNSKLGSLVAMVVGLTVLLLPFGWWAGAAIGTSLDRLTAQAHRMSQFDFTPTPLRQTRVQEANNLSAVMNVMGQTIHTFLELSQDMATEPKVERMINNVLQQMVSAMRCTAGAVYIPEDPANPQMQRTAAAGELPPQWLPQLAHTETALTMAVKRNVSPGVIERQIELRARSGRLEGLLLLQHRDDADHAEPSFTEFVAKLSGMLAVSIETRQLFDAQKNLLDALVRLLADAIDAKSPYTGGHCERVPQLAGMLVDHMHADTTGPYAAFRMSEEQRYEFHLGAWLHDCGKVTSPEHIIDKATKLEGIYNRIHEVRMRFEVLWRDAELAYLQAVAAGGDTGALRETMQQRQQKLENDFAFVARCNIGGESMSDADIARLSEIAKTTWTRHFDDRLGLSPAETRRLGELQSTPMPVTEQLLADRVDHVVPWGDRKPAVEKNDPMNRYGFDMVLPLHAQNMGELYNLSIRKGTLTAEDRFKINDHMVQTLVMLRSLPWPPHMALVPEIAATHHEKLDGTGYPRRLPAADLTLADRVMAVADIFEALTAADRPYKAPNTLNESLRMMATMANNRHIDAELFRYFLHSGLWLTFAKKFMRAEQIDTVDVDAIVQLITHAETA
jgi:HD-GYP domain-containing protein (c-di-GMP phosphodiesterase class II)